MDSTTLRAAFVAGAIITFSGCGGGGGDDSPPPPNNSGGGGPPIQQPITINGDLSLHGQHFHMDQLWNRIQPRYYSFDWSVLNSANMAVNGVEYRIRRLDGSGPSRTATLNVGANTVPGPNVDGHTFHVEWDDPVPGRYEYELVIDPNNMVIETNETNNRYEFVVDVPTAPAAARNPADDLHIYGRELHYHAGLPSNGYDVHFQLENTFATSVPGIVWRLQCASLGIDELITSPGIGAGARVDTSRYLTIPPTSPGDHEFIITIDPDNAVSESDESDNVRTLIIRVPAPVAPG